MFCFFYCYMYYLNIMFTIHDNPFIKKYSFFEEIILLNLQGTAVFMKSLKIQCHILEFHTNGDIIKINILYTIEIY